LLIHRVIPAKAGIHPEVDPARTSGGDYLRLDPGVRRDDSVGVVASATPPP